MEVPAGQQNTEECACSFYDRLFWAGFAALAFALFKLGAMRALWDPGESRYAEISREMLESGDYLVPHLNYVPYFEKPPLGYWLNALGMRVFGVNEFGARFFTIVSGLVLLWGLYRFAKKVLSQRAALLSAAVLASSLAFFLYSQINELDMLLSVFVCWALFLFYEGFELRQSPRLKIRLAWLLLGLGCLVKGPVALVLAAIVIGPYLLLSGQLNRWRDCRFFEGFAIFIASSAPWFIAISKQEPEFFKFFFIREHLQRYTTSTHNRKGSIFYFVPVLLLGIFPWTASFFQPLKAAWQELRAKAEGWKLPLFLLLWAGMIFAFFSLSGSKRPPYMVPAFPALCLLTGKYWDRIWDAPAREQKAVFYTAASLYAVLAAGLIAARFSSLVPLEPELRTGLLPATVLVLGLTALVWAWKTRNSGTLFLSLFASACAFMLGAGVTAEQFDALFSRKAEAARIMEEHKPGDVISSYHADFDRNCQSLSFYTRNRVVLLGTKGELETGAELVPDAAEYFPTQDAYLYRYAGKERFFAIIKKRYLRELAARSRAGIYVPQNFPGPLTLISNRPWANSQPEF